MYGKLISPLVEISHDLLTEINASPSPFCSADHQYFLSMQTIPWQSKKWPLALLNWRKHLHLFCVLLAHYLYPPINVPYPWLTRLLQSRSAVTQWHHEESKASVMLFGLLTSESYCKFALMLMLVHIAHMLMWRTNVWYTVPVHIHAWAHTRVRACAHTN